MDLEKFKALEREAIELVRFVPYIPHRFKNFLVRLADFLEWQDLLKELGK